MHRQTTHLTLAAAALALMAMVGSAPTASAQPTTRTEGFALNRFEPSVIGSDWFATESLDLRGNGRFSLGVVADYARKPLVVRDLDGNEVNAPIEDQLYLRLGGSVILRDRIRISAMLPLAPLNSGTPGSFGGMDFEVDEGVAIGDLRVGADLRLLGNYGDVFTAAVGAFVFVPTGDQASYMSDGTVRVVPRLSVAGIANIFQYGARVGYEWRNSNDDIAGTEFGSELEFAAAAGLRFLDGAVIVGPELYGSTVVSDGTDAFFGKDTTALEAVLGAHFMVARSIRFAVGAGPGLDQTIGTPAFRAMASLAYFPDYEQPDRDKDGIPDNLDGCPADAGLPHPDPELNGCPDSDGDDIFDKVDACPLAAGLPSDDPTKNGCPDSDGDGIVDPADACPLEPGEANDDPAKNGCPPPKDTDGDGIVDPEDACPLEAGEANEDPMKHGCPPPPDTDGDGVVDPEDACLLEPGVADPDPKKNGCPPDRDGDHIPDAEDACPDEAGDPDPNPAKHGCPKVILVDREIKILERVEFDTGRATIRPTSDPLLNAVLRVLKEHQEILRLEVQGHTDSRGSARYNRRLSQKRAESVMAWLVMNGIDQARLTAVGYGEDKPIDSNRTRTGRQANRRVQFIITEKNLVPVKASELQPEVHTVPATP